MSERKQPDRIAKKRTHEMMMAKSKSKPIKFDLIGELLSNYGEMTGGNIVRQIYSYMDFSTLQQSRLVSKSWNLFLINNKKICLKFLEKHLPNLIYFTNQLAENEEENSSFWKEFLSSIEKADNNSSLKEIFQAFKKVQGIFEIVKIFTNSNKKRFEKLEMSNYLPQNFNDDFVGEKVKKEIRREIKKKGNRFLVALLSNFRHLEQAKKIRPQNPDTFGFNFWSNEVKRIKDKILCECKDYLLNVQ